MPPKCELNGLAKGCAPGDGVHIAGELRVWRGLLIAIPVERMEVVTIDVLVALADVDNTGWRCYR